MGSPKLIESFLSATEADVLLAALVKLPWSRGTFMGRPVPRDEVWMGPYPYKFSGRTLNPVSWTPEIEALRDRIQTDFGGAYNSVLLNRYRDGRDSVSWHADDEPEMDSQHPIASVSLGACREFLVRDNDTRKVQPPFLLSSGSLLIMPAGFQSGHQHSVPKTKTLAEERVNLTFRRMLLRQQKPKKSYVTYAGRPSRNGCEGLLPAERPKSQPSLARALEGPVRRST